ncbi:hypothetical protein EHJ03_13770 [Cronobacter dublinensis]|nr:hypothetical protein [Cronobacter dublinensis]
MKKLSTPLPQTWSLNEKASRPLIRQRVEAGIRSMVALPRFPRLHAAGRARDILPANPARPVSASEKTQSADKRA